MVVDPALPEGVEQHVDRVTVRLRDGRTLATEPRGRGVIDAALRP